MRVFLPSSQISELTKVYSTNGPNDKDLQPCLQEVIIGPTNDSNMGLAPSSQTNVVT